VPDYFVTSKKTYTDVGVVNKHIRDMLTRNGLQKSKVKAVALSPLKEPMDEEKMELVCGVLKV